MTDLSSEAPSSRGRITSVEQVGVMVATDRREGLEPFDAEAFLRDNRLFERLRPSSSMWRTYTLRHTLSHLVDRHALGRLRILLTDIEFLAAFLADRQAMGLPALLRDYTRALEVMPRDEDGLRAIFRALELSLYLLTDDPSQLPQQIVGRLAGSASGYVRRLLAGARSYLTGPSLLPLTAQLTSPAGPLRRSLAINASRLERMVLLDATHCCVADPGRLIVWDLDRNEEVDPEIPFGPHGDEVTALAHDPAHALVAAALREGPILVWDLESRQLLHRLPGHGRATLALAVAPTGELLSGGSDGALHVWDLEEGELRRTLSRQGPPIHALTTLPDGVVVSGGGESFDPGGKSGFYLWRLADGEPLGSFGAHEWPIDAMAATSDGREIVSAANHALKVWDVRSGTELAAMEHVWKIHAVCIVPGRDLALAATGDDKILVYDLDERRQIRELTGHHAVVSDLAVSPDARRVVSVSWDQTVKIWDLDRASQPGSNRGHSESVEAVVVTPDGRFAISSSKDHTLIVWDLEQFAPVRALKGHEHWVQDLALTPDGRHVLSASWDGTMRLWDLASGELCSVRKVPDEDHLGALVLTSDGRCAVAATRQGRLIVWDLDAAPMAAPARIAEPDLGDIDVLVPGPDGGILVVGSRGSALWSPEVDEVRCPIRIEPRIDLPDHADEQDVRWARRIESRIAAAAFLPQRPLALLGTGAGALVLWDFSIHQEVERWPVSFCGLTDVAVTADGCHAVVTSGSPSYASDNTVRLLGLRERKLLAHFVGETPMRACAVANGRLAIVGDAEGRLHFLEMRGLEVGRGTNGRE